jgi:hypothetical protein
VTLKLGGSMGTRCKDTPKGLLTRVKKASFKIELGPLDFKVH